jgi:hypothetical protein
LYISAETASSGAFAEEQGIKVLLQASCSLLSCPAVFPGFEQK